MTFQLEWQIEGEKQLSRRLRGITADIKNLEKPFKDSATMLRRTFEGEVFESRGGAIDERWAPLSPVTIARKSMRGQPLDPLIATGKMRKSFYTVVSSDQAVIGNSADYFKYHQSNRPRRKLPRRVMMKLGNRQRADVVRVFQTYLQAAVKKT